MCPLSHEQRNGSSTVGACIGGSSLMLGYNVSIILYWNTRFMDICICSFGLGFSVVSPPYWEHIEFGVCPNSLLFVSRRKRRCPTDCLLINHGCVWDVIWNRAITAPSPVPFCSQVRVPWRIALRTADMPGSEREHSAEEMVSLSSMCTTNRGSMCCAPIYEGTYYYLDNLKITVK